MRSYGTQCRSAPVRRRLVPLQEELAENRRKLGRDFVVRALPGVPQGLARLRVVHDHLRLAVRVVARSLVPRVRALAAAVAVYEVHRQTHRVVHPLQQPCTPPVVNCSIYNRKITPDKSGLFLRVLHATPAPLNWKLLARTYTPD